MSFQISIASPCDEYSNFMKYCFFFQKTFVIEAMTGISPVKRHDSCFSWIWGEAAPEMNYAFDFNCGHRSFGWEHFEPTCFLSACDCGFDGEEKVSSYLNRHIELYFFA